MARWQLNTADSPGTKGRGPAVLWSPVVLPLDEPCSALEALRANPYLLPSLPKPTLLSKSLPLAAATLGPLARTSSVQSLAPRRFNADFFCSQIVWPLLAPPHPSRNLSSPQGSVFRPAPTNGANPPPCSQSSPFVPPWLRLYHQPKPPQEPALPMLEPASSRAAICSRRDGGGTLSARYARALWEEVLDRGNRVGWGQRAGRKEWARS